MNRASSPATLMRTITLAAVLCGCAGAHHAVPVPGPSCEPVMPGPAVVESQPPVVSPDVPAGQLAGVVVDSETRAALPYSMVDVRPTGLGATTDSAGRFVIRLPDVDSATVRVRRIGYDPFSSPVAPRADSGLAMTIVLRRASVILCDVTTGRAVRYFRTPFDTAVGGRRQPR